MRVNAKFKLLVLTTRDIPVVLVLMTIYSHYKSVGQNFTEDLSAL